MLGAIAHAAQPAHDRRPDPIGTTALDASHAIHRLAAYLWASPNSMIGALAGAAMCCAGGQVQRVQGVAEFHGGALGRCFASLPHPYRFAAITFGHVILGTDVAQLDAARR